MYVDADNLAGQTHMSFSGDRIFVNRCLFNYREPSRWHVTVFRYPAKPQVNYIKRLIGLENETLMLRNGQVFVQKEGSDQFEIQRKPLRVLLAMLRPVDDNDYVQPAIHELGWKTRWYGSELWKRSDDYKSFTAVRAGDVNSPENDDEDTSWLKFRYITASTLDWYQLIQGKLPEEDKTGTPQLITDTLDYNTYILQFPSQPRRDVFVAETSPQGAKQLCRKTREGIGLNWVGDLAMRCTINAEKAEGTVTFRLVKGGINFQCSLDLATGNAVFSIPDVPEFVPFSVKVPMGASRDHDIMFCNVDEEMRLIIDGKELDTHGRGHYDALCGDQGLLSRDRSPTALDLEPAAIGVNNNTSLQVSHLKIMRNMYYISCDGRETDHYCDLVNSPFRFGYSFDYEENVKTILSTPACWREFGKTRQTVFTLEKDQFLMCGDNSAQSKDSRLWTEDNIPHYVERQYLIGEALFVFWPHGFRIPGTTIALIPNFSKMRWID
jgi:signal peptidase I